MKGKNPKFSKSRQEIERQSEVKVVLILNAYTEPNSAQFFWINGETQRQNSNHLPSSYPFMPWLSFTPSLPAPLPTVGQQVLLFLCCKFEASTSQCSSLGTRLVDAPLFIGPKMRAECRQGWLKVGLLSGFFLTTFQRLTDNADVTNLQLLLKQSKPQQPFTKLK